MPRLCYGSAKQINLFCTRLNRKVHLSVFTFQFVSGAGIIFNTREMLRTLGSLGIMWSLGSLGKSPLYPRYPLSPQRSCRLKQAKNSAGIIFNTRKMLRTLGSLGIMWSLGSLGKSPLYPRYPLSPQRSCRLLTSEISAHRAPLPNFLSEGVRCGLDKEIRLDGTYLAYFPFSRMIERSQMTPCHKKEKKLPQDNSQGSMTEFLVRRASDLGICRRLKKRSLLSVNEHFSDKQSVKDDPLSQEIKLV